MYRILLTLVLLLGSGCAYYNTFYNSRKSYTEALEYAREHPDDPAYHEKELLDASIEGAGRVLSRYPDSRWVDDAQLLLGDALLLRGMRTLVGSGRSDFEQAVLSYSSSIVMTESQEIMDRARLGLGKAAMRLQRYNDAAAAFSQVSGRNGFRYSTSRLLLCEAYLQSGDPELAMAVHDTLIPSGGDSLEAEYYITGGRILTALGMPDSGAVYALRATEIESRGDVYYRALVTAAESYIEAGMPGNASEELNRLLQGYRSDREMADISLLRGEQTSLQGIPPQPWQPSLMLQNSTVTERLEQKPFSEEHFSSRGGKGTTRPWRPSSNALPDQATSCGCELLLTGTEIFSFTEPIQTVPVLLLVTGESGSHSLPQRRDLICTDQI